MLEQFATICHLLLPCETPSRLVREAFLIKAVVTAVVTAAVLSRMKHTIFRAYSCTCRIT